MKTTKSNNDVQKVLFRLLTVLISLNNASCSKEILVNISHYGRGSHTKTTSSSVTCAIPSITGDCNFAIEDTDGNSLPIQSMEKVPRLSELSLTCTEGYSMNDGKRTLESVCNSRGRWNPPLKSCYRMCPLLIHENMNVECKLANMIVDCRAPLITGTKIHAKCKSLYSPSFRPDYSYLECLDSGEWDNILFKCVPECGIPREQTLIENGSPAPVDGFPWLVAVYRIPQYLLICAGTLITPNIVISAAHCFYNEMTKSPMKLPDDYEIVAGKYTRNYNVSDNRYQQTFQIRDIIFYDRPYDPGYTYNYGADIALVVLKNPVTISSHTLPACFAWDESAGFDPGNGVCGVLAGWGRNENGTLSERLSTAELPYIKYEECVRNIYGLTVDKFCAGSEDGPKPGLGDSGGGLMFKNPKDHLYYLRGIVSTSDRYCNLSVATFTDVSMYKDWIQKTRTMLDSESSHSTALRKHQEIRLDNLFNVTKFVEGSGVHVSELINSGDQNGSTYPDGGTLNSTEITSTIHSQIIVTSSEIISSSPKIANVDPNSVSKKYQIRTESRNANKDPETLRNRHQKKLEHENDGKDEEESIPKLNIRLSDDDEEEEEEGCGKSTYNDYNIVDLRKPFPGAWPWMVALISRVRNGRNEVSCAGTMVSDQWVLTTAFCAYYLQTYATATAKAFVGGFDVDDKMRSSRALSIPIHRYVLHPGYSLSPRRIASKDSDQPVCLPKGNEYLSGDYYTGNDSYAVGYNADESFLKSHFLYESSVIISNHTECVQSHPHLSKWLIVDERVFCTKRRRKPKCQVYLNGSPLMFVDQMSKAFVQSGIKSYHIPCDGKRPDIIIYVKVAAYLNWIREILNPL